MPSIRDYLDTVDPLNEFSWPFSRKRPAEAPEAPVNAPAPVATASRVEPATAAPPPVSRQDFTDFTRMASYIKANEYGIGTIQGPKAFTGQIREICRIAHANKGNALGAKALNYLRDNQSQSWMPSYVASFLKDRG